MSNQPRSKTSLFLMELIIVILFFSICSAICMRLFAMSQITSQKAASLTGSVLACQSVAEVYKAEEGDLENLATLLDGTYDGDKTIIYYSDKWERVGKTQSPFYIVISETDEDKEALVVAFSDKENNEVFSLKVKYVEGAK